MNMLKVVPRSKCFLELYWTVTRYLGIDHIHGREKDLFILALKSIGIYTIYIILYPIYYCFAKIMIYSNTRLLNAPDLLLSHVGHLSMDLDCYFKDQILSNRKIKTILVGSTHKPANKVLFEMWSQRMHVVQSRALRVLAKPLVEFFPEVSEPITHYGLLMRGASRAHLVQSLWDHPPLLSLDASLIARGEEKLLALGLPKGAWFVCVHAREPGYAPSHEWASTYRNSDILTYVEAMRLVVARGGWCIRMGDATMKPLPAIPGVIDYAISPFKEDWMDVFLCAQCRFFLGSTSGIFGIASIFGRPAALANIAPLSSVYSIFPNVMSIPKLIADANGQVMNFFQAFKDEAAEFRYTAEFEARGLKHIDNTPEEIADLVSEMLDWTDSSAEFSESEFQVHFRSLVQSNHYCAHSSAKVSDLFLRRHHELLWPCFGCVIQQLVENRPHNEYRPCFG